MKTFLGLCVMVLCLLISLELSPSLAMPTYNVVDCEKCKNFNVLDETHSLCSFGCSYKVKTDIPENADMATLETLANKILPLLRLMRNFKTTRTRGRVEPTSGLYYNPQTGQLENILEKQQEESNELDRIQNESFNNHQGNNVRKTKTLKLSSPQLDHGVRMGIPRDRKSNLESTSTTANSQSLDEKTKRNEEFDWVQELNSFIEDGNSQTGGNSMMTVHESEPNEMNEIPDEEIDFLTKKTAKTPKKTQSEGNLLEMFYNEDSSLLETKRFKKD